ncbi:hypothetical protein quinque_006958 [Culex quinquefasciatus]
MMFAISQQKFLKRPADDVDSPSDSYEPPVKLAHNGGGGGGGGGSGTTENLTKFSVEIVQQLEFTTSAANSQPQQISTNVTVKALTNASVKSEGPSPAQQQQQQHGGGGSGGGGGGGGGPAPSPHHLHDLGHIVDFKQEPENEFADLSAALEKDAAANGHFPGLSDLIGDDTNDESDTFKDLISDLSDFHSDFLDFEEKPPISGPNQQQQMLHAQQQIEVKQETCIKQEHPSPVGGMLDNMGIKRGSPVTQQQQPQFPNAFNDPSLGPKRGPYGNPQNGPMAELSPAAQTLKHMAEQHQHKNAMGGMGGVGFPPRGPQGPQGQRPPYADQFGNQFSSAGQDFMGANPAGGPNPNQFHKGNVPPFPGADLIKQELYSPQNDFDLKPQLNRIPGGPQIPGGQKMGPGFGKPVQQQQYSPYGSPAGGGMPNHGSPHGPGYIPPRGPGPGAGGGGNGGNNNGGNGGTGPGSGGNGAGSNGVPPGRGGGGGGAGPTGGNVPNAPPTMLQMKQTQQLHISQQGPGGHGIQHLGITF